MYNVRWLAHVARDGLDDLLPAVRQAFNDDPLDDRLSLVYGPRPRLRIVLLAIAGIALGIALPNFITAWSFREEINWPAVVVGIIHAALFRRYLFRSGQARADDFPWLAASLAPATVLLMLLAVASAVLGSEDVGIGVVLVAITDALGVAAALAIAVAALCFSRDWVRALADLAVRLLVFRIMVWVTVLVMLEIGIVGPVVSGILRGMFNIDVPDWLPELFDQISYAGLMAVVYLAVIGATWTVCRDSFAELLASGHVNVVEAVAAMADDPKRAAKKAQKKARKAAKADPQHKP